MKYTFFKINLYCYKIMDCLCFKIYMKTVEFIIYNLFLKRFFKSK